MAKPLVLSDIRNRAGSFVADWRHAEGYERGEAQEFVRGLLQVFGISGRTAAVYEKRAQRASTGQRGYIDALISGTALIEMKSAGEDLVKAEGQALDYVESLTEHERPSFIITSDFRRFRVLDLTVEPDDDEYIEFPLAELPAHVEDIMFLAGYRRAKFGSTEQERASIQAAQLMAKMYEHLERTGYDDHQASIFLIRTLFCLYADDAGLWERDLFSRYIEERTSEDGSDLGAQLATLYQALNKPESKRYGREDDLIQAFPYVNGSVFGEAVDIPYFDRESREQLLQAAYFNWSSISPAIFGSLFQAVKDKKARRALGEHYTTETNILKVIRPLFLDELEERFTKSRSKKAELERLLKHLGSLQFLDPACGCGNFLIIAYRELRALELRIHERLQELDPARAQLSLDAESRVHVKLSQFHGIELEEWPATIARTAMFLVEHQANQAVNLTLGYAVPMLPLQDSAHITVDNALRTDWNDVLAPSANVMVMGNPPFLGHATRTPEQAQELRHVWQRKDIGRLDYVTGWYRKALDFFGDAGGRFAFVSTNSITQGEPVPALFGPIFDAGWRIRFAHRTFAWSSEAPSAASVYCTIISFDRESARPRLFTYATVHATPIETPVTTLNAYLIEAPNVLVEQRRSPLNPQLPALSMGSMPRDGKHLLISEAEYEEVMADPIAAKYVRRFVMGKELIHNLPRWCLWMVDLDPADVKKSPVLANRIEAVRAMRLNSAAPSTRAMASTAHLFGQRSQPGTEYLATPHTFSENRAYATAARLPPTTIAGNKVYKTEDPDGFAFAIISSSMFITWQKSIGGRLENRPVLSNTLTWNSFPLPDLKAKDRQRVIEAGMAVVEAREQHPDRTLAEHYTAGAMSPSLLRAHAALDRAVDRAAAPRRKFHSNEQRAQFLFERYSEMTAQ